MFCKNGRNHQRGRNMQTDRQTDKQKEEFRFPRSRLSTFHLLFVISHFVLFAPLVELINLDMLNDRHSSWICTRNSTQPQTSIGLHLCIQSSQMFTKMPPISPFVYQIWATFSSGCHCQITPKNRWLKMTNFSFNYQIIAKSRWLKMINFSFNYQIIAKNRWLEMTKLQPISRLITKFSSHF